jgi:SET domain-containing protein
MIDKSHKTVYKVLILILLILCILLGYKVDKLEKTNQMKPKLNNVKYYTPLDERLTIKPSEIEGLGLFAEEDIPVGDNLGVSHVYDERFKNKFIRTPLGGFINHSDTPNVKAYTNADFRYIKTLRHIKAGEELTLRYNLYNVE